MSLHYKFCSLVSQFYLKIRMTDAAPRRNEEMQHHKLNVEQTAAAAQKQMSFFLQGEQRPL